MDDLLNKKNTEHHLCLTNKHLLKNALKFKYDVKKEV